MEQQTKHTPEIPSLDELPDTFETLLSHAQGLTTKCVMIQRECDEWKQKYKDKVSETSELLLSEKESFDKELSTTAAERDSLIAGNAELRHERDSLKEDLHKYKTALTLVQGERDKLKEEVERLNNTNSILAGAYSRYRQALEAIVRENYDDDDKKHHLQSIIDQIKSAANHALNP